MVHVVVAGKQIRGLDAPALDATEMANIFHNCVIMTKALKLLVADEHEIDERPKC